MKKKSYFNLNRILGSLALFGGIGATSHAQLISNGSFEAEPVGTTVVIESTDVVDFSTFTDWRFFSVGSPPNDFSAILVTNASDGNVAMQLDMTANGSAGGNHGLDRAASRIPVEYGTNYRLSFDAAWISGSANLVLIMQEQTLGGGILATKQLSYPISNGNYQQFIREWTPSRPTVAALYLQFMPQAPAGSSLSLLLDHIRFEVKIPPNLILGDLLQTYDGSAKTVSSTTLPMGLAVDLTYDGATNEPVNVGSYTVVGTINDASHQGTATNTLVIQTSISYNAWKTLWFTEEQQTNGAASGPEIYFDEDAFNNWNEYISGTDPTDPQSFFEMDASSGPAVSDEFVLNWSSVSGRVYSVSWTPDLLEPFIPLQTYIAWPRSSYTNPMSEIDIKGFYRMGVISLEQNRRAGIIGSTHVIPAYFFGVDDCLNEGADALLTMGTKVIKIWYYNGGETPDIMYPWNSSWTTGATSLLDGLNNTHYTELFDKPFQTFVMNVASFVVSWNPYYWKNSITQAQIDQEEDEFYEFAKALLQRYAGTGKTFVLQHHEGDWHTRNNTDASIPAAPGVHNRMVQWLNARQRGVTRARDELGDLNVFVYHATEINLVVNSMNDGQLNMVNDVLPLTIGLDLVSYSCYDASINPALTGDPEELRRAIQYIKQNMPDSAAFGNDNVYLGEYGIPETEYTSVQVELVMKNTVTIGLDEKCPYILYWMLYDGGHGANIEDLRGFWLIRPDGTKSWHYEYLKSVINE